MTELRDARLHRALRDAPDDGAKPAPATRQAILAGAHEAVRPRARASWWQRVWGVPSERHMPWNAAFATVAIASLVTVLWHDREVPDARLDSPQVLPAARDPAPVVAPAPRPEAAPAASTPAQSPAKPAVPLAPVQRARPVPPQAAELAATAPAPAELPPVMQPQSRGIGSATQDTAAAEGRRSADAAPGAMRDQAARSELAKAGPAATLPAPAAAPTAPAAPPPTLAAAPAARTAAQMLPATSRDALRITLGSRVIDAPLSPASGLAQSISRVVAMSRSSEALDAPVDAMIELLRDGQSAGVLELTRDQVRWSPANPGEQGGTGRPDAALLQSMRDDIARLAR